MLTEEGPKRMEPTDIETEGLLGSLFERRYLPMVRLAQWLLGDWASAEDATQEAFARLYPRLSSLTQPEAADGYLRVMVVNQCRSMLRRRRVARRYAQTEEDHPLPDGAEARADTMIVTAALRRLPGRQRECLVLRYYLDLSEADVASSLEISAGSVKRHTARALAAMTALLGGQRP